MNAKKSPSPESLVMLKALQDAVTADLARKKKLGQYAVVWEDGRPVLIGRPDRETSSQILK